jgi:Fasciclin domain
LAALSSVLFLTSCNKDLEQLAAIPATPYAPSAGNIAATLTANPNDSLFNRMLIRSGLQSTLTDSSKSFTIFAVDNAGMKVFVNVATSGFIPLTAPDSDFSKFISGTYPVPPVNLSAAQASGIIAYSIIGQKYPSTAFPVGFPNYPLPSFIQLPSPAPPFAKLPTTIAKGSPFSYVNNIPITGVDQIASNGVIHHTFTVVAPPSATLRSIIAVKPNLSYFRAALLRADSGAVVKPNVDSTNFLNYLVGYGVTNMTILAPDDAAFQTLIFGLVYSQTLTATGSVAIATATANGAVAAGPAFLNTNNVSTALIKGIVAHHFLASNTTGSFKPDIRVFSVNVPSTAAFVKTLVSGVFPTHPGVRASATFTGPVATAVSFAGAGTFPPGGTPFSQPANVIDKDNHGANGVLHIIDRVMLPQ